MTIDTHLVLYRYTLLPFGMAALLQLISAHKLLRKLCSKAWSFIYIIHILQTRVSTPQDMNNNSGLLADGFDCSCYIVFHFCPDPFNWVKICTIGRNQPPLDILLLEKVLRNMTRMFRIIILHESTITIWESFTQKSKGWSYKILT